MKKIIAFIFISVGFQLNGQTEMSARYDHIGTFHHGYAVVVLNGKKGLIDSTGKEAIKPEWDNLSGFGKDGIGYAHKGMLVGLINRQGTILAQPNYLRIGNFTNGRAVVVGLDNLKGIIDITGKVIVEPKYQKLKVEEGGIIRATVEGKEVLLKVQ
jgi:hypothetical protein